jgi:outer membrane protein insertion porin family
MSYLTRAVILILLTITIEAPALVFGMENTGNLVPVVNQAASLEIDRIEIKGVTQFKSEQLEKLLILSPGDRLDRGKVVQTEENIQAVYKSRGYADIQIQSRLTRKRNQNNNFENILEFQIKEGFPIRISSIRLISDSIRDEVGEKIWNRVRNKVIGKIGILPGEPLDQDRINESRKTLQELIASEGYVGARVLDVTEAAGKETKDVTGQLNKASEWINIDYHLELGDRVSFGFRGSSVFTYAQLLNLVEEQRLLGLGKDYLGAIRNRIEDEYHSVGYALINITPYTFEEKSGFGKKVTYMILEGPRVSIDSIDFDGNSIFSSSELREKFFSKASGLVQNKVYVEKDVQKAAEILVDWMKERGYLSARVVTINHQYLTKDTGAKSSKSLKLLIYLYEGDQTQIQTVSIHGAQVFDENTIKQALQLREGAELNLYGLTDGIERLKKMYQEKGYLNFKILNEGTENLAKYSQENRLVDISLNLEEGQQFKIKRIDIEGLENTKDFVVRRELAFRVGDVVMASQLNLVERNLRKLGIFSTVGIRVIDDPGSRDGKDIRIVLREADRGLISGGPGYRNDLGVRAFGQLAYTNLWGEDHTASVNLAVNRRFYNYNFLEGQAQIAYSWPWFLIPELYFRPFISFGAVQYMKVVDSVQQVNFAAKTLTVAANWQRQLLANPNIVGEVGYSFESINQFMSATIGDDQQLTIGTVTPKISLDKRDNPLNPITGYFATTSLDFAMPFLGSSDGVGYYRAQLRADYYLPVLRDVLFYASFRSGYEQTLEPLPSAKSSTDSIPLTKQFTLGGIGSLRAYQLQELNYQGAFRGRSLSYVNYRTELDLPFAGALKLAVFLEAGNLLIDHFTLGSLVYDYGFGFHYVTPVGPVSFDYGIKLAPLPGTESSTFNFSVGVI